LIENDGVGIKKSFKTNVWKLKRVTRHCLFSAREQELEGFRDFPAIFTQFISDTAAKVK